MNISVIPRATEKAYAQSLSNTYVFNVPLTANKQEIVAAVEAQFEVKVTGIKTLVQNGKAVRFSRGKNRYPGTTNRKDTKKAYVTLAKGDSINVFEQPAEEEEKK
ncbi:50S ribosomal protein L23 [Streptomyces caniscabiei]|uniref:50S ribosomal protein L23 n=1 Tax=Streptomyces caniscabiei TaxID=2746961 RepID=UPI0029AF34F1|nr:50S ribosomal protein L23 [Streptomyces caniscabiei]MDX2775924.1 50S ribosomal protein L23 [Streptomyces caniscabiei]